jgi:HAMP domain-containing protein
MNLKGFGALLLAFFVVVCSSVLAQGLINPDTVKVLASYWIILLVAAFGFIVAAVFLKNKFCLGIGVIFLFITVIIVELGVLIPMYYTSPQITYQECTTVFAPDISIVTVPGLFYATSCILTGYSVPNYEWLTIATFFIFGIILPAAFLLALFSEFISSDLITHEGARRVIVVVATLFAFRGVFATFFIQMLSYGFAGIGALLAGVLFTGIVWRAAYRFVSPLGIEGQTVIQGVMLGEIEMKKRELMQAEAGLSQAKEGRMKEYYKKEIDRLIKDIQRLTKEGQ